MIMNNEVDKGKRRKRQFIADLKDGDIINDMFAVKFKKPPKPYERGYYFEIRASDRTGEVTVKYWGGDKESVLKLYDSFNKGDVIHITGSVVEYKNRIEIAMDESNLLRVVPREEFYLEDFVGFSKKDVAKMRATLLDFVEKVKNPYLKALLESFFKDEEFMKKFSEAPAAMHHHQNYLGGLIEHTLNVARLASSIYEIHPDMDYDLLITGALLHDVGKIKEFEVNTSIDVSREGMLLGHIVIGKDMVNERISEIEGFPENLSLKLQHIILSHHGKNIYGSPKEPQLPEAMAIYMADELDAKLDLMIRYKSEAQTEDPWIWTKIFGHIYLE
jgi:3'-5' exoribonuclease